MAPERGERLRLEPERGAPDLVLIGAPLVGYAVGVASHRRRHALAGMLEAAGARSVSVQALRVVTPPHFDRLRSVTVEALVRPIDELLVTSNFGLRSWLAAAQRWGLADELVDRFRSARLLASTSRAADGLRELGLSKIWSTAAGATEELFRYLAAQPIEGRRVLVQSDEPEIADLCQALRRGGADVLEVPTFDTLEPVASVVLRRLADQILGRQIDALVVADAPSGLNLIAQATWDGRLEQLLNALAHDVPVVAVGEIAASPFVAHGIGVTSPPRPFLDDIVTVLSAGLPRRALLVRVGGHRLEVRGQAVIFDDELIPVQPGPIAVLRALARQPGRVVSLADIRRASPNWSDVDDHAIEMAVSRLRRSLHNTDIVQTVIKRGYRLNG